MNPNILKSISNEFKRGTSIRKLSKLFSIPKSSIYYNLKYRTIQKKIPGKKPIINKNDKRKIISVVDNYNSRNEFCSSSIIRKELNLKCCNRTIQRCLRQMQLKYFSVSKTFHLTPSMKRRRVEMAKRYIIDGQNWKSVVFSDEKYFTLKGADLKYYWSRESDKPLRFNRLYRSSGVMVWAMLMPNGLLSYRILEGKQNSSKYINILTTSAMAIMKLNYRSTLTYQHDNAPIHVSKQTKKALKNCDLKVIEWPAYSPDLNIIENVWAILGREIYKYGAVQNLGELRTRIKEAIMNFNETKQNTVSNLYESIPERLVAVICQRGERLKC